MHKIIISENDAGQRLDKFIGKFMPSMPKSMLYKLIRKKDIKYNHKRCKGNEILRTGDVLDIYAKEEFFTASPKAGFQNIQQNLCIVYEDTHIMILYKPAGQDAHSSSQKQKPSLIDEVKNYLYQKGEYHPQTEQSFSPALCNRIDRNTEGLVIAAKNAAALRAMNEAIRCRQVRKLYLAVTSKPLPDKQNTCTAWLKKDHTQNRVRITENPPDNSWQEIRTSYKVLAQNGQKQLVKIDLLTGRTHQIRAHLAYLGAPLLGDRKYTDTKHNQNTDRNYQALCAYQIAFSGMTPPLLHYLESRQFTAPMPDFVKKYFPDSKL